jgi:hypothetical protein
MKYKCSDISLFWICYIDGHKYPETWLEGLSKRMNTLFKVIDVKKLVCGDIIV